MKPSKRCRQTAVQKLLPGARGRLLLSFLLISVLSACAGRTDRPGYVYRSDDDYVRLVPVERGAPANSHPFDISADQLSRLLAGVSVKGAASTDRDPVFTKDDLDRIASPLAVALSNAGPKEDVTFIVTGHRGLLGAYSSPSATAGRLFVRDGAVNIIFGAIQEFTRGTGHMSTTPPAIAPGSRSPRSDPSVWKLSASQAQAHEGREDWIVFDPSAISAKQKSLATPGDRSAPAPTIDSREQEIESRLRALNRLRERDAITEQEYVERRREILREL